MTRTFYKPADHEIPPQNPKTLLLTGAGGFLGRQLQVALKNLWPRYRVIPVTSAQYDLLQPEQVSQCLTRHRPHVIVHAACPFAGSGIGYAKRQPCTLAAEIVRMDSLLIQACKVFQVETFVGFGSVCAYPLDAPVPASEADLWSGPPEPVNGHYGEAKRMQLSLLQAARKEWGLNGIHLILANLYGSGDTFAAGPKSGHVIPATIVKCVEALASGAPEIVAWGDGSATRSFLHVVDAAGAVAQAIDMEYASPEPVNICSEEEISIRGLVEQIAALVGYQGQVRWDPTEPGGQPRRRFSNTRARTRLQWAPMIPLAVGLRDTIQWYRERAAERAAAPPQGGL